MRYTPTDTAPAIEPAQTLLAIDVGAGTQDILVYDADKPLENCAQLVMPSQTTILADRISRATRSGHDIFLYGSLMGGGPMASALKKHLRAGYRVFATPRSAMSVRDNPAEVEALGVQIVDTPPLGCLLLRTSDVDVPSLRQALALFGIVLPERAAIAVQDHGETFSESQRRFRFRHWESFLAAGGDLDALLYTHIPPYLTRMRAVQQDVPGALLMDTGPAAVLGAMEDPEAARHRDEGMVVVNIGNQHTFAVLVRGASVWGLFEHHTVMLDTVNLGSLVAKLQAGAVTFDEVYDANGHGAAVRDGYQRLAPFGFVAVTGPNRRMAEGLGYHLAAPHGDMMMTGPFGLVAAARSKGIVR